MDQDFGRSMDRLERIFEAVSKEDGGEGHSLSLETFEIFWNRAKAEQFEAKFAEPLKDVAH